MRALILFTECIPNVWCCDEFVWAQLKQLLNEILLQKATRKKESENNK